MTDDFMLGLFSPLSVDDQFWDQGRAETAALLDKLGLSAGSRVLVMPAGAGAHAVALAEAGMDVVAVGSDGPALEIAEDRARDIGVELSLVTATLDGFQPEGRFDLVLNLSSSVDFLAGDDDGSPMLRTLGDHLTADGTLVLRLVSLDARQRRVQPRNWTEAGKGLLVCEELEYDWEIGWVRYRWLIVNKDGRRYEFHLGHQGYDVRWVVEGLERSGYAEIEQYGSLGGDPFEPDTPLVVFARRNPDGT